MKTTVEISDALLKAAKRHARRRGMTLRALLEEGLRRVLREEPSPRSFRLRRVTFRGTGRGEAAGDWETTRDMIYPNSRA